jgi:tetratricopeptide (TPR) repeat protein
MARDLGQAGRIAQAANGLAQCLRMQGRWHDAITYNEETLQLASAHGDRQLAGIALLNLAMLHIECREPGLARLRLSETAALGAVSTSPVLLQSLFEAASGLAVCLAHWDEALHCLAVAQSLAESNGLQRDPADDVFLAHQLDAVKSELGEPRFRRYAGELASCGPQAHDLLQRLQVWLNGHASCGVADACRTSEAVEHVLVPTSNVADGRTRSV